MDIRQRLEVFGDTDELAKLLYIRTRTSPDELLMECRDSLLGMFSDLHEAADEIERLREECNALRKLAESKMDDVAACRQELADMMAALEVKKLYWDGTKYVEAQ